MLFYPDLAPIELQVADRLDGQTRLMQVAHSHSFLLLDQPDGSVRLYYTLRVRPHAVAEDGELGTPNPFGYTDREVPLFADNNTAVNPDTGELRFISKVHDASCYDLRTGDVVEFAEGETWLGYLESLPDALMLQGFFFAQLRDNPLTMRSMLIQNIQQADAMGRFA